LANSLYCLRYFRQTHSAARRVGSLALAAVSAALMLEAAVFVGQSALIEWGEVAHTAAALTVRSALLLVTTMVSLLIWRSARQRRR
jgi:hypothetical protein